MPDEDPPEPGDLPTEVPEDDGAELPPEQPYDAASPAQRTKRQRRLVREEAEARRFWEGVFASEAGRREMWGILQACGTFETKFLTTGTGFPHQEATWFHAGERAIGQRLYHTWTKHDRAGVFTMMDEHHPDFRKPK